MAARQSEAAPIADFAESIYEAYLAHRERFDQLTAYAAECFAEQRWLRARNAARERLDLYTRFVDRTVADLKAKPQQTSPSTFWAAVKKDFAERVRGRPDFEFAETFFNSVTRHLFNMVGVDADIEFTTKDFLPPRVEDRYCPICQVYRNDEGLFFKVEIIANIFNRYRQIFVFQDIEDDIRQTARAIETRLLEVQGSPRIHHIEMLESVFYRGRAAYLIGRIRTGIQTLPLVIALRNRNGMVAVDAVLATEREISILFSFTHSYFQVAVDQPTELINFLKTIIPRKRVSELYTSLGFFKHGKAELYRELSRALTNTRQQFQFAPGEPGMVMSVFTLPSFNVVFKVIKDRFEFPKQTSSGDIKSKYRMVFYHDRVGRLVDAQEYSLLEFDRSLFPDFLLDELIRDAGRNIVVSGLRVVVKHVYVERRVTPLDVYLKGAMKKDAIGAVIDYGNAIKELAAINIFPGDLFLKNFGVTRYGRVVFYDYDEVCLVTDCRFRRIPKPRNDMEAFSSEPWYPVDDGDVFPEEFRTFLTFPKHLRDEFEKHHGDLFDVAFWHSMQEQINRGEYIEVYPYDINRRFRRSH